jgi:hypothetical protein
MPPGRRYMRAIAVEVRKETQKTIPLPPLLGGVALAGGIILVLRGRGECGVV